MARPDMDHRRLALNLMHWLSGLTEPYERLLGLTTWRSSARRAYVIQPQLPNLRLELAGAAK
jgi:hypothetical protein